MSTFIIYFRLGYRHILDIYGVDYILFIIALMAIFLLRDWRKALLIFLFYVLGNTLTLSLAVYEVLKVNIAVIEYLIPVTIFISASLNILKKHEMYSSLSIFRLTTVFVFGLVHGFGFADYLKDITGSNQRLLAPLIGFDLGIGLGMLITGFVFLIISWIFVSNLGFSRRDWNLVISSGIAGIALTLMFESRYWL